MRPSLDDAPFVEDEDLIGAEDRAEANVGMDDGHGPHDDAIYLQTGSAWR